MRTFVSISYFILLSVFLLSACGKHEILEADSYYYFQMNWGWGDNDDSYYYYGSNWEQQIDTETLNFIRSRRIIQGFYPLNN